MTDETPDSVERLDGEMRVYPVIDRMKAREDIAEWANRWRALFAAERERYAKLEARLKRETITGAVDIAGDAVVFTEHGVYGDIGPLKEKIAKLEAEVELMRAVITLCPECRKSAK